MFLGVIGNDQGLQTTSVRGWQKPFENGGVSDVGEDDEWTLHGSFPGAAVARPGGAGNWFTGAQMRDLEAVVDA